MLKLARRVILIVSNMAGFSYRKNLDGSAYVPSLLGGIGVNSGVFSVGDVVRIDNEGFISLADAATDAICGVVQQVVTSAGASKSPDSGTTDTYTMTSDNETVALDEIRYIPALANYLFYNDSSGTLAQSNLGQFFSVTSESQVDQSTATDTAVEQFRLVEIDPDGDADASKGLFQIAESQFGQIPVGLVAQ